MFFVKEIITIGLSFSRRISIKYCEFVTVIPYNSMVALNMPVVWC